MNTLRVKAVATGWDWFFLRLAQIGWQPDHYKLVLASSVQLIQKKTIFWTGYGPQLPLLGDKKLDQTRPSNINDNTNYFWTWNSDLYDSLSFLAPINCCTMTTDEWEWNVSIQADLSTKPDVLLLMCVTLSDIINFAFLFLDWPWLSLYS